MTNCEYLSLFHDSCGYLAVEHARLVAPVFGVFLAELFGWRLSFFVLAVVWGILAFYAYVEMVESCPDGNVAMCSDDGGTVS